MRVCLYLQNLLLGTDEGLFVFTEPIAKNLLLSTAEDLFVFTEPDKVLTRFVCIDRTYC